MAGWHARSADGETADDQVFGVDFGLIYEPMVPCVCAEVTRTRVDRGPHRRGGIRLPPVSSPAWRDRAAMSPVCQIRWLILLASDWRTYARSFPVSVSWPFWRMSVILPS